MRLFKDPLLTASRWLINFAIVVCGFVTFTMACALPAVLFFQDEIVAEFAEGGKAAVGPDFFLGVSAVMIVLAVVLALAIWFLLLLRQIVGTVEAGDPFIEDNATRLTKMGWIAVATQAISIPLAGAVIWTARMVEDQDAVQLDKDVGFDLGGITLILVLFILARVFRQGARMREDLEGTV